MEDAAETKRAGSVAAATHEVVETPLADQEEAPAPRYAVDLMDAFGVVCDKAKNGVQSCQAIAAFVQERANMEAVYARALTKTAMHATADDWAPGFANCWRLVQETLTGLAKLHTESAAKMQSSMAAGARAFAAQQEVQVQRLIAEGTKFRTAQQNMMQSLERAKEKYDKRCAEAIELSSARRPDTSPPPSGDQSPSSSPVRNGNDNGGLIDEPKEIVGQLLTKMWDTTSSFTKSSAERQRSKLEGCLDELVLAEKQYAQCVDYVNSRRVVLEREISENLVAFQLTEEQRVEYLSDLLVRLQKTILRNLDASSQLVAKLRDGTSDINEFVDIEDGFRKLSTDLNSESKVLDPADNAFYQRMRQVQAMSDRGHNVIRVFHSTVTELMSIEDHFVSSSQRLLRGHESVGPTPADLFSLSPALSQVVEEGSTMAAGWKATKEQTQRFWEVRVEFRSLLAEPVALNIASMKLEYENARNTTQESFSKVHSALSQEATVHQKLKQKLNAKSREFAQVFAALPDMGEIDLRNLDVTQVLVLVHQMSSTFSEKERRIEGKLKGLGDEVREAQQKVSESLTALRERSSQYAQDVDVFISAYMKNEKFRLQVEKSSVLSLTKALEHTVEGALVGVKRAIQVLDLVSPSGDVAEFVMLHRKPRMKTTKITPVYNPDEGLKGALDEYYRNKAGAASLMSSEEKRSTRNGETKTHPSPIKRTNSISSMGAVGSQSEKGMKSVMSSVDEEPLIAMSDFQKQFNLEAPEQVVESYSCALYANNFPNHGRMYLTTDHLCFTGWRETVYVVSYLDITLIEKKNSALIVPNALEITANGDKVFFTSFVFRDECLQCILQLQAIQKATTAAIAESLKPSIVTDDSEMVPNGPPDVPSPSSEAAVVPSPSPVAESKNAPSNDVELKGMSDDCPFPVAPSVAVSASTAATASIPTPVSTIVRMIPKEDAVLTEFEVVVDEEVPLSVEFAYSNVWIESTDFFQKFLERGGETSISISPWERSPVDYTAITKSDSFHGTRRVSYTHNKKYMVGPSAIPTMQTQRFTWDAASRLVVSVTTVVSDAPYCDYFRAENRWVFSNTAKEGVCRLQVGISMQWVKSTWLKKQIESTAMGEAKEYTRALIAAAVDAARHASHAATAASVPPEPAQDLAIMPSPLKVPGQDENATTAMQKFASDTPNKVTYSDVIAATSPTVRAPQTYASPASPAQTENAAISVQPDSFKSLLQAANLLCLVLFVYTMYRIGSSLDQMQALTREALIQQRQQQELFRDILLRLQAQGRDL